MKKKLFVHIIVCLLLVALFSVGCANVSHSSGKSEPTTPRIAATPRVTAEPTEIPDYKKISIAKDFAYLYQNMLDWNAPYGVDHFSTVSIGSASVNKDGLVVVKGICYGKDEYGRSVGRYTFEWKIEVDKAGWGNSRGISFKKD